MIKRIKAVLRYLAVNRWPILHRIGLAMALSVLMIICIIGLYIEVLIQPICFVLIGKYPARLVLKKKEGAPPFFSLHAIVILARIIEPGSKFLPKDKDYE